MLIFKDGVVADYRNFFSNTSFPPDGPNDVFLNEHGAYKVNLFLPHDRRTEKLVPCEPYIQDGWAYAVCVEPKTQEEIAADAQAAVPRSITPRQCRLLLLQQGLLAQVEAMIAQQDEATRITWEYAIEFRRDDPLLLALAADSAFNLTPEQLDQFFIAAAQL